MPPSAYNCAFAQTARIVSVWPAPPTPNRSDRHDISELRDSAHEAFGGCEDAIGTSCDKQGAVMQDDYPIRPRTTLPAVHSSPVWTGSSDADLMFI